MGQATGKGSVKQDHYFILGVTPTAGQAEIRSAYRTLMRRFHPDADPSAEAAERARDINAAYAVLSNPERRSNYDEAISARRPVRFELDPRENERPPRRSILGPIAATGFGIVAAAMIAFAISPSMRFPNSSGKPAALAPAPRQASSAQPAVIAKDLCNDSAVNGLIRNELFRRAAGLRPDSASRLRQVEQFALTRFESAAQATGRCSGWLSLDIPPTAIVDGGRTNLNAEIAFQLTGSRNMLQLAKLEGADRVVRSLATIGPPPKQRVVAEPIEPEPAAVHRNRPQTALAPKPGSKSVSAAAAAPRAVPACEIAHGRADRIICESSNLKALDRQLASFYRQSWERADEPKRAALLGSRQRFNDRRNACTSSNCMTRAYVARLSEISDIMAGRGLP